MLSQHELDEVAERIYQRLRNHSVHATINLTDDTKPVQLHQSTGYIGELRDNVERYGEFGHGSVPLPGAAALIAYQGGMRSMGTILGIEDPRYRPRGYKPGEAHMHMVDGAGAEGNGGKLRMVFEALLGWVARISGKAINIGTMADTVNLVLTGQTINITGQAGDVVVNGISLVNHVHSGVTPGGGDTGPPVGGG